MKSKIIRALVRALNYVHAAFVRTITDGGHRAFMHLVEILNDLNHHDWTMLKWVVLLAIYDWVRKDNRIDRFSAVTWNWIDSVWRRWRQRY